MTRVKICGITSFQDALCAADAGADYLGFIFFRKSPRYVTPERAAEIIARLTMQAATSARPSSQRPAAPALARPRFIGVFVNEPLTEIEETIRYVNLDYAQLHGDEPPAVLEALNGRGFKALRPTSAVEARIDAEWYSELGPADGPQMLIDAFDAKEYGGTGKRADWDIAADLNQVCSRLALAGGLTSQNVAEAVAAVRPWAVDVSSGVEIEPGRKDPDKVRAFVSAAKGPRRQATRAADV